jgi:hypothetical protein
LSSESIRGPFHVIEGSDFDITKQTTRLYQGIPGTPQQQIHQQPRLQVLLPSRLRRSKKFSKSIITLSQGTGNSSQSSSARVPGPRASYILPRRVARADDQISPQQASTLGSRVVLNITTTSHFSPSSQASTVTIQRPASPKMASRSFKPASYLTSAPSRSPRQRPAFTRTSSGSSTLSTTSEDSFTNTLRGLCANDSKQKQNDDPGKSKL